MALRNQRPNSPRAALVWVAILGLFTGARALAAEGSLWSSWSNGSDPSCASATEASAHSQSGEVVTKTARCDELGGPLRGPARLLFGQALDLNQCGVGSLQVLPGIGPKRARAIVDERPFAGVGELRRVRGLGAKSVSRLAPFLSVGGDVDADVSSEETR